MATEYALIHEQICVVGLPGKTTVVGSSMVNSESLVTKHPITLLSMVMLLVPNANNDAFFQPKALVDHLMIVRSTLIFNELELEGVRRFWSIRFKDSRAVATATGCWSLEARARRFLDCHRQGQDGFGRTLATMRCWQPVLTVEWSFDGPGLTRASPLWERCFPYFWLKEEMKRLTRSSPLWAYISKSHLTENIAVV